MQELAAIHVDAPPERVFDLMADDQRRAEWMIGVESFEYASDVDPDDPLGAAFTQRIREGGRTSVYQGEVTAFERPSRLAWRLSRGSHSMLSEYHLTPFNGGTLVSSQCAVGADTWLTRVMDVLFGWLTRRIARQHLAKLKELAEAA